MTLPPLDLVEGDLIAGAVVELRGARAFVRGHAVRVFECAAGVHRGGDAGRPKGMTVDPDLEVYGGRIPHRVRFVTSRQGYNREQPTETCRWR